MTSNILPQNSYKTEVIVLGPKNLRNTASQQMLTLDDIAIASSNT